MLRKKRLGDRLVEAGIIDKYQLRAALGQQTKWGHSLGRTLLEMRVIEEDQLIPILSEHINMPAVTLAGRQLNPEAVARLSEEFCRDNECVPFDYDDQNRFLDMAMTDAQNQALYDKIRVRTRCNIRPYLAGPNAVRDAIDRAFGEDLQAMKLQFMLTENVIDFGEENNETLETELDTASGRGQVDPNMCDALTHPSVPEPTSEPTPEPTPAVAPAPRDPSDAYETPIPRRPSGAFEAAPAPPREIRRPYTEELPPVGPPAAPPTGPEYEQWIEALEERLTTVEDRLDRQDLFVQGLVNQMRELFGQLAAHQLLDVDSNHPLIKTARPRRSSRPPIPAGERPRRPSHPVAPAVRQPSPPTPVAPSPAPTPVAPPPDPAPAPEPDDLLITVEEPPITVEEPPPRQRRLSHPFVAVSARQATPPGPVASAVAIDDDDDDAVEFVAGSGRLVQTAPRPSPESVRPSPPRKTSGAETKIPLVEVPANARCVVAMDLGTTRSSVATVINGQVSVLKLPGGDWDIPSVVGFRQDGSVMLGKSARMMLANDPENAISSPKRLLGHRYDEHALQPYVAQLGMKNHEGTNGEVGLEARGRTTTVTEVCAHIFNLLRLVAEKTLDREVEQVILTTPVSFGDRQYRGLAAAAQLAKLEVLEFIPEPVAATLSCVSDPCCHGLVAVYDFGGGTFDFSIINVAEHSMKVVATSGDAWLGGDDFDEALAGAAANAFWQSTQIELRNQTHHWQRLLFRAEGAKRNLTENDETTLRLPGAAMTQEGELDLVYPISRHKFSELCQGIIRRSLATCGEALEEQGLTPDDLSAVYISGGTTYIPAVREAVAEFFGQPPRIVVPPERAVLLGAAIHGSLVHSN